MGGAVPEFEHLAPGRALPDWCVLPNRPVTGRVTREAAEGAQCAAFCAQGAVFQVRIAPGRSLTERCRCLVHDRKKFQELAQVLLGFVHGHWAAWGGKICEEPGANASDLTLKGNCTSCTMLLPN